jgi:ribosomal-protein-alanine N-acetyltransferase
MNDWRHLKEEGTRMQGGIRGVQVRDLTKVMQLEVNCFEKPWDFDTFHMLAVVRGHLKDGAKEIEMVVYESEGEVVGYTVWEYNGRYQRGHILNIAVEKEYRRRGIATLLLEFVFDDLRRRKAVSCFLEVREHNLPARNLYEKVGLVPTGRSSHYYGNEDAIIYQNHL